MKLQTGHDVVTYILKDTNGFYSMYKPCYVNVMHGEIGLSMGIVPYVNDLICNEPIFEFDVSKIVVYTTKVSNAVREMYDNYWKTFQGHKTIIEQLQDDEMNEFLESVDNDGVDDPTVH